MATYGFCLFGCFGRRAADDCCNGRLDGVLPIVLLNVILVFEQFVEIAFIGVVVVQSVLWIGIDAEFLRYARGKREKAQ